PRRRRGRRGRGRAGRRGGSRRRRRRRRRRGIRRGGRRLGRVTLRIADCGLRIEEAKEARDAKEAALRETLASLGSVIVAYSGGVDSVYLAWVANDTLGDRAVAITADSPSYPERHRALAVRIAREFGLRHEIIRTGELDRPEYRANPENRCYYCKHELYTHLTGIAAARGIAVIVDGANADDRGDYRPGRQAAREFGIRRPLDEVNL